MCVFDKGLELSLKELGYLRPMEVDSNLLTEFSTFFVSRDMFLQALSVPCD